MKKKLLALGLTTTMITSVLAGCSGSTKTTTAGTTEAKTEVAITATTVAPTTVAEITADEPTTITFWHSMGGVNGEAIDTLIDKFNKENTKGITVESQYQGSYDDTINKLKSAQIGNMGADLVQIYDIGTRFMIDSGWVVPMQELIDADGWDVSQLEENIAAYYSIDNQLYSMPFNSSTPILYYNKDMFDAAGVEVPTSLEGIEAVGDALMNDGGAKQVIAIGMYGWFFEEFLCKQGLHYVNNGNGREGIATAVDFDTNGAAVNILTAWQSLYEKGYAPNVGRTVDAGVASFCAEDAAMTAASTASLKQILSDVDGKFEVGTAYFPKVYESNDGGVSVGGGSFWALNNEDEAKKAATWEFVKFMVSAESQAYWSVMSGYFPITVAAHDEAIFKENMEKYPQFQTAIDQLHDSNPSSVGALFSVFSEARVIVSGEIENTLNNGRTPEEGAAAMAKSINAAIEDYNLVNN